MVQFFGWVWYNGRSKWYSNACIKYFTCIFKHRLYLDNMESPFIDTTLLIDKGLQYGKKADMVVPPGDNIQNDLSHSAQQKMLCSRTQ